MFSVWKVKVIRPVTLTLTLTLTLSWLIQNVYYWCHVTSCHVMSRYVTLCNVMVRPAMPRPATSCHVRSRLVTSCHVMPRCVTSCHITSCHVVSRHVTYCHVMPRWLSRRVPISYRISGISSSSLLIFWPSTCREKWIKISKLIILVIYIYIHVSQCEMWMNGNPNWIIKHDKCVSVYTGTSL